MKMRIPGKELADDVSFKLDEQEILTPADYGTIADGGLEPFYYDDYLWRVSTLRRGELPATLAAFLEGVTLFFQECARRERRPFFGASSMHPFFTLSLMRSMVPFTQDLYGNPDGRRPLRGRAG